MKISQLKEQVRGILRERSVKAIQKEYSNVIADMEKHLELYKKSKGTPEEKKHIGHLKTLTQKKKSLQKELDLAVANLYKNAELKVDEAITNPKKSNPNDLATTVIGWYDFATDYIDDGGQRRRAEKSNDDVVKWFDSHPLDVKKKAFKVMLSKQPSIKSKIERVFSSSLKESVNEDIEPQTKKIASLTGTRADAVKQFVSTHGLNITKLLKFIEKGKLSDRMDFVSAIAGKPNNPIQKKIIKMFQESMNEGCWKGYKAVGGKMKNGRMVPNCVPESVNEATKVHFEKKLKNGTSFQVIDRDTNGMRGTQDKFRMQIVDKNGKVIKDLGSHPSIKGAEKFGNRFEAVNEVTEPQIISQLKDIVKNKQYQSVKDPKSGKSVKVDMQTANSVLQIYNGLSNVNKDNMVKMGLPKMIDVSFKIINKYK